MQTDQLQYRPFVTKISNPHRKFHILLIPKWNINYSYLNSQLSISKAILFKVQINFNVIKLLERSETITELFFESGMFGSK